MYIQYQVKGFSGFFFNGPHNGYPIEDMDDIRGFEKIYNIRTITNKEKESFDTINRNTCEV